MPKQRGVSSFWLDIKALENDRTHLIGDHGAKQGMLLYGLWVRLFTWQYKTAAPIRDYQHVARLTGLNIRTAQRLMRSLVGSLPGSLIQRSGQWYCRRTIQLLDKVNKNQQITGATVAHEHGGDPDPDPDLGIKDLPSQDSGSGEKVKSRRNRVRNRNFALFWSTYPIKRGKKRAEEVWKRKDLDKHSEMICADVERRKRNDEQWGKGYIPHPTTYLNGHRWEDELAKQESSNGSHEQRHLLHVTPEGQFIYADDETTH